MKNKLIKYFSRFTSFSADEEKALMDSMVIREFKKGDYLLKEGQVNEESYFILDGCIRQFKIVDGEEITTNFFTEEQWIISLTSFTTNTISSDYLVCIEDTRLVVGDEQKAQELFKQFPRFETISRAVMETVFAEQQQFITSHLRSSPEERYLNLLHSRPDLLQRVPQHQLASYIGVKPESLSRIRKRVAKNEKQS